MNGLTFLSPFLLIGLAAAAIPPLLHLLARIRARRQTFPTLRFLRRSAEATARKRRLKNWLVLLLRSLAMASLAVAVAQPMSRAASAWMAGDAPIAVIVLDDSYSMEAPIGESSAFMASRDAALQLLAGEYKPSRICLLRSTRAEDRPAISGDFGLARKTLADAEVDAGPSRLDRTVAEALRALQTQPAANKALYVFSDLQQHDMQRVLDLPELADAKDVHWFFVHPGLSGTGNVGLVDLAAPRRVRVGQTVRFRAELVNSHPRERTVGVQWYVGSEPTGEEVLVTLAPAGEEGHQRHVAWQHDFTNPGPVVVEVRLREGGAISADDVRRTVVLVQPAVEVLLVGGSTRKPSAPAMAADWALRWALDWRTQAQKVHQPWYVHLRQTDVEDLNPAMLRGADAAVFSDVPGFSSRQSEAIQSFVTGGGLAWFFLGPGVDVAEWNRQFASTDTPLLPGTLSEAVGEVGPEARVVEVVRVDTRHPFLAGLYENKEDYPRPLCHRYFPLTKGTARTLLELEGGDPLLLEHSVGAGRVVWCTTSASPRWSLLMQSPLLVSALHRSLLLAGPEAKSRLTVDVGGRIVLPVGTENSSDSSDVVKRVRIIPPSGRPEDTHVEIVREGLAETDATGLAGLYRWTDEDDGEEGVFVVNPAGREGTLEYLQPEALQAALHDRGCRWVAVGESLDAVHQMAAADAGGRNWWDVLAMLALGALLIEAIVANRRREVGPLQTGGGTR